MDFGIQMWGYNRYCAPDPVAFYTEMKNDGYTIIEPDLKLDDSLHFDFSPVWSFDDLAKNAEVMRPLGLKMDSVHIFGDIIKNVEKLKDLREKYGIRAVLQSACSPDGSEAGIAAFAKQCMAEADVLSQYGLELWLHTGSDEVRPDADGVSPLEKVLTLCGGKVWLQLDVGWTLNGGADPVEFLKKLAPYLRSIHYKDMAIGYEQLPFEKKHTGLGRGALDVKGCWEASKDLDVTHILDQDASDMDMMDDARTGLAHLKKIIG